MPKTAEATHVDEVANVLAEATGEVAQPDAAPFVYNTETTEVARTFVNQVDRLTRLLSEDAEELRFLEAEHDRQINELVARFDAERDALMNNKQQAVAIINARSADRTRARASVERAIEELRSATNV